MLSRRAFLQATGSGAIAARLLDATPRADVGHRSVLKMVAAFEESTKKYPLIPMGAPDPYRPLTGAK